MFGFVCLGWGELCESYAENDIGKSKYRIVVEVTMSSSQRSGKAVAPSSRKRVRTGITIPLTPTVPRGQTQRYGAKAITSKGKKWNSTQIGISIPILTCDSAGREGMYFIEVMRDRVCLVYALMKDVPIKVGAVLKSDMRKARVHRGRRYAFGRLITNLCRQAGVPKESVDYIAPLFTTPLDVTKTKGPKNMHGPTLTTAERNRRD
ncbi:hypothetical protein H5410_005474 [Solanum commersonii]|uniref:Uncharacterized protein n=1 Tax=Solanum commersonii TaxID=4109 RepID=A0A9J6A7A0_SOLCO|nr:hypothetical protein H5410_005474 [Solanum commersonii]